MTNNRLSEAKRPLAERTRSNVISISAYKRNVSSKSLIERFMALRAEILASDTDNSAKNRLRSQFKYLTCRMIERGGSIDLSKACDFDRMLNKFASFFKSSYALNGPKFTESLVIATITLFNALNKQDRQCY